MVQESRKGLNTRQSRWACAAKVEHLRFICKKRSVTLPRDILEKKQIFPDTVFITFWPSQPSGRAEAGLILI